MNRKMSPETLFSKVRWLDLLRLEQRLLISGSRILEALLESDLYISLVLTKSTIKMIIVFLKGRIIML